MYDIWFIADTHFDHAKIIEYEQRPFSSVEEMNETMIQNWNQLVKPEDQIWHLGDFALSKVDRIAMLLSRLNGHKCLVRGNHDDRSVKRFVELGFEFATDGIDLAKFDLTHIPVDEAHWKSYQNQRRINVHGHVHSHPVDGRWANQYYCVSVEMTGYKPVHIDQIWDERCWILQ